MSINKVKIMVILGILVLSITAGLFIQIFLKEMQSKSEQTLVPTKLPAEQSTLKNVAPRFPSSGELNVPVFPIPKPNPKSISKEKSLPNTVVPFFENINKAIKKVEESILLNNTPAQNISTVTPAEITLSLSKNQFNFLYPNYFIASLIDAQNLFIKEQDPTYEPILKIETDAQVRFIEEKIVATLLSTNMITKERAEQFITTIRFTLPKMQLATLQKYNSSGFYEHSPFREFLSAALGKKEPPQPASKGLFLAGFIEKLADALAHKAQAICGTCTYEPLCYQVGVGAPLPGSATIKFACYCTGCLESLGCLSSCNGAAIYDQFTGICGCG